ncbi:MAG: hypothetical protein IPL75_14905 [Acidobacteria bacterium]|nr:hypothetical protein [Acidobacteriota bacterium]
MRLPTRWKGLAPRWHHWGRLIGEPDFGPVSRAILAFGEAATFGLGLACGLRRRE